MTFFLLKHQHRERGSTLPSYGSNHVDVSAVSKLVTTT
jgi:hypothetical protein